MQVKSGTYRLERTDVLVPYANNARTHSDEQIGKIARSIQAFGFTNPVLIGADRGIIAGHGRVLAARQLGIAEVPVVELAHLSPEERQAYILADNRLALDAGWDDALLRQELGALDFAGFDLTLTGFSPDELATLRFDAPEGLTDPDEAPEPPAEPVTVAGDVWLLGRHRVVCGDSTDADTVAAALAGTKPHLMVTDPPYGVDYDPTWREDAARKGLIGFSPSALGKVQNDGKADWREAWALFPGEVAYVWHASMLGEDVAAGLRDCRFDIRSLIIWGKSSFAISRGHYHWQHETCFYAVRKGGKGHWHGDRSQSTLWLIPHVKNETGHSTQKPVECMKRPIENNSSVGQAVYEPFSGSGTTIIAAEMTGRACHAIELAPAYVDVAVLRWQAFTGQTAKLEATGRSFAEMAAERVKVAA